jgi:hypothetical protein
MHRLETSTTQADAAWAYLLDKSKSFSKPVNEITALNLRHVNLKKPKITLVKNESIKEKVSRKISALFVGF